jgi:hypothetical protein
VIGVRRVTVYVDGFNLYYALLKPNPAVRWLDLAALGAALRPAGAVTVRYFTAKVLSVADPNSEVRQRLYLKAIGTLPNVTVEFYGPVHVNNPRDVHSNLALAATSYGRLDPTLLPKCQLPETVPLPTGRSVTRPATWR